MTAPSWHEDDPKNLSLIQSNAEQLLTELRATAAERILPTPEELCRWHARLYAGCDVPVAGYLGHFRGDPTVEELVDYEVGLGARLKDGNLEKMGVWARRVGNEMNAVLAGVWAMLVLTLKAPTSKKVLKNTLTRRSRSSRGPPRELGLTTRRQTSVTTVTSVLKAFSELRDDTIDTATLAY